MASSFSGPAGLNHAPRNLKKPEEKSSGFFFAGIKNK
jgi:hypothetical protein